MRKLVKVVAALVGLVVVLVVALVLLLQTGAASNRVKDLVVPRVSEALGRDVTVKDARLHLFPPHVALGGTTVAGRPGEPALVDLESFDVGVAFWPLVTSLGKDIRVTEVKLVRPTLNLVRAKDGTWNYEGLGGEKKKEAPKQPEATAPGDRSYVVEKASIQDGAVRLVDHASGDQAAVAISKIDFDAENVGLGQPLAAKLSAAIAGAEKNFQAQLHSPRLPDSPAALREGKYPELSGAIALQGLDLAKLRGFMPPKATGMMTGGRVDAQLKLTTQEAKYHVDGDGKLSQLKLRGEPAQGSFALHAVTDPAKGALSATIDQLAVKGPGVDLGGKVTLSVASPAKVRFDIKGALLDLGQVLALVPPSEQKKDEGPLLTPELRKSVEAMDVAGTIAIDKVQRGALVATNFKANAGLDEGLFALKEAGADFFAGRVDLGGTKLDLSQADPRWDLEAKLDGVDMEKALGAFAGGASPLAGKLTGALALSGAGVDWAAIQKALTGQGGISIAAGALTTTDLGDKVLGAVSQGLKAVGKGGAAGAVGSVEGGKTTLKDLAAHFTVKDGAMALSSPLSFTAPFGQAKLGGKIGLGGQLALEGTATVAKEALAKVVGGGVPLPGGLDVPLGLGGTLSQPSVQVNAQQAVAGLVSGAVKQQANQLKDKALRQGRQGVQDALKGFGIGK